MSLLLPVFVSTSPLIWGIDGVEMPTKELNMMAMTMAENEKREIEPIYEIGRADLSGKEGIKLIGMEENECVYASRIEHDNHLYYYDPHLFERFVKNIGKTDTLTPIRKFISDCLGVKSSNLRSIYCYGMEEMTISSDDEIKQKFSAKDIVEKVYTCVCQLAIEKLPHRFLEEFENLVCEVNIQYKDYIFYKKFGHYNYKNNFEYSAQKFVDKIFTKIEEKMEEKISSSSINIPKRLHSTLFNIVDKANISDNVLFSSYEKILDLLKKLEEKEKMEKEWKNIKECVLDKRLDKIYLL